MSNNCSILLNLTKNIFICCRMLLPLSFYSNSSICCFKNVFYHPYCNPRASSNSPIVWIRTSLCSSNAQLVCSTLCETCRSVPFVPGSGTFSLRHCSLCAGDVAGFGQCFAPPSVQSMRIDIFFTARREVPHLLFITALKLQPRPQALVTYAGKQKSVNWKDLSKNTTFIFRTKPEAYCIFSPIAHTILAIHR